MGLSWWEKVLLITVPQPAPLCSVQRAQREEDEEGKTACRRVLLELENPTAGQELVNFEEKSVHFLENMTYTLSLQECIEF